MCVCVFARARVCARACVHDCVCLGGVEWGGGAVECVCVYICVGEGAGELVC